MLPLSADCKINFVKTDKVRAGKGIYKGRVARIADCKTACLNEDECVGFDHDFKKKLCWVHTTASRTPLVKSPTTDNYRREDSCKETSGMYSGNLFRCCSRLLFVWSVGRIHYPAMHRTKLNFRPTNDTQY